MIKMVFYVILYDFGVEALEEILPYLEEKPER